MQTIILEIYNNFLIQFVFTIEGSYTLLVLLIIMPVIIISLSIWNFLYIRKQKDKEDAKRKEALFYIDQLLVKTTDHSYYDAPQKFNPINEMQVNLYRKLISLEKNIDVLLEHQTNRERKLITLMEQAEKNRLTQELLNKTREAIKKKFS